MLRLRVWALSFAVWILLLLLSATQAYVRQPTFPWLDTIAGWAPNYLVRAALTPFALLAVERVLIALPLRPRAIASHILLGIAWSLVYVVLETAIILVFWPRTGRHAYIPGFLGYMLTNQFLQGMLSYWSIAAVGHAFAYYRRFQERQHALREAQLEALRRQLNPHFLFNALNTISILVDAGETRTGSNLLVRLSELLRSHLADNIPHEVPLTRELELIEGYLEIEQARFGDRLRVEMAIAPGIRSALVPAFLLQPLVENAIHHGIALREEPGCVRIHAEACEQNLRIEVRDDGPGLTAEKRPVRHGIGLSNTRARLEQLYPGCHSIDLRNTSQGGLLVSIRLPLSVPSEKAAEALAR